MYSSIVIDISVIVHLLTDKTNLGIAARSFFKDNSYGLIAPPLLLAEAESTFNLLRVSGKISKKELLFVREVFDEMKIKIIHLPTCHLTARKIGDDLRIPRVYDATFAALAMLQGVEYFTADKTFYNAAHRKYDFVQLISA